MTSLSLDICSVYGQAAAVYRECLTPERRELLTNSLGLGSEIIDLLSVGYAPAGNKTLQEHGVLLGQLVQTGLIRDPAGAKEVFTDCYVCPLFSRGQIVYMVGIAADSLAGQPTFLKPILHSPRQRYVKEAVSDRHFFCADMISGSSVLVVPDIVSAAVARQIGIECICPAAQHYREQEASLLVPRFRSETLVVVMAETAKEQHIDEALCFAEGLSNRGIAARVAWPEGDDAGSTPLNKSLRKLGHVPRLLETGVNLLPARLRLVKEAVDQARQTRYRERAIGQIADLTGIDEDRAIRDLQDALGGRMVVQKDTIREAVRQRRLENSQEQTPVWEPFFNDGGFIPSELAQYLMGLDHYIYTAGELYKYDGGVYKPGAVDHLRKEIIRLLAEKWEARYGVAPFSWTV